MATRVDVIPTSASTPRRAWFALAVLLLPVLLIAVDNTILAFALPSIARTSLRRRRRSCGSSTCTRWCLPRCW